MDAAPSTTPLPPTPRSTISSRLAWILASLIVTVAISLAAAHAPARIRLIGLFSIACGLLIGWILNRLAQTLEIDLSRRWIGVAAAVLTCAGLIGGTYEIVRLEILKQAKSPNDAIALRIMEEMDQKSPPASSLESKSSELSEFRRHLAYRIRQLGEWPSPWPEVFWSAELFAAAAASYWISNRPDGRALRMSPNLY